VAQYRCFSHRCRRICDGPEEPPCPACGWADGADRVAPAQPAEAPRRSGGSEERTVGTAESQPILSLELPPPGEVLLPFRVSGWAIDRGATWGPGVERIEVLDGGCDGVVLGEAEFGLERQDVAGQYGERFAESGWQFVVDRLSVGDHLLGVRLVSELSPEPVCNTVAISVV